MKAAHLIPAESLKYMVLAEKQHKGAAFTVRSVKTGKDYTYKIKRTEFGGKWYTHIYVEVRYLEFKYLGVYKNGHLYYKQQLVDSPSAIAIAYVLRKIVGEQYALLSEQVEVMALGKCLCCGRALTDADSIAAGIGPVCRSLN
jgi:hypothetical protein